MPFKPSTAKKYARLILQWMLPIGVSIIPLYGAYRAFTVDHLPSGLLGLYYAMCGIFIIFFIGRITVELVGVFLNWVYEVEED